MLKSNIGMEKAVELKNNDHNGCQAVLCERSDCERNMVSFLED